MQAFVVAARNSESNPDNWWKYRYENISVMKEFVKLMIYYFFPCSDLAFKDDFPKLY
jgi:hypothetical protein